MQVMMIWLQVNFDVMYTFIYHVPEQLLSICGDVEGIFLGKTE